MAIDNIANFGRKSRYRGLEDTRNKAYLVGRDDGLDFETTDLDDESVDFSSDTEKSFSIIENRLDEIGDMI